MNKLKNMGLNFCSYFGFNKRWYSLVVLPGSEKRITNRLIQLSQNDKYKKSISDVRVVLDYSEEKPKIKDNFRQLVFIKMNLNNETYQAVKIDGVRSFIGDNNGMPIPLSKEEAKRLFEAS